ncbi:MAG: sporulation protein YabP [Lachnospirales bacterium]
MENSNDKHSIIMDNREFLSVSGVLDVISFDEEIVVTDTTLGLLIVRGVDLHISNLNIDGGHLSIDGNIYSINYEESSSQKNVSLLKKLFK